MYKKILLTVDDFFILALPLLLIRLDKKALIVLL